jgi:hypothetical protein
MAALGAGILARTVHAIDPGEERERLSAAAAVAVHVDPADPVGLFSPIPRPKYSSLTPILPLIIREFSGLALARVLHRQRLRVLCYKKYLTV